MRLGEDHTVTDSKGKTIAILLASQYPTEWSIEQARRAFDKGQPEGKKVTIKARRAA